MERSTRGEQKLDSETIVLYHKGPGSRRGGKTMHDCKEAIRTEVYDHVVKQLEHYGAKRQPVVKHASIFDFRRVPLRKSDAFMREAESSLASLAQFCRVKRVLTYDAESKSMKQAVRFEFFFIQ